MLDAGVLLYVVVEGDNAVGLLVFLVLGVDDVTVPKGVVGKDETTGAQNAEYGFIGLLIGTLVAVDKGHVELDAQFGGLGVGITDDEGDFVGYGRVFYPGTGEVFLLVVDFEGVEMSVVSQPFCHAEGGIATEGAHL